MSQLYVPVVSSLGLDLFTADISSLITLFTVQYCRSDVRLILVPSTLPVAVAFKVDLSGHVYECQDNAATAQCCQLPAIVLQDGITLVAGLCAVLRHIAPQLLGFRRGCLVACAEVSLWTRFCEIELPSTVEQMHATFMPDQAMPRDAVRFEAHMAQPPRVHNVRKQRQELARRGDGDLEHAYSEGPNMTLSDVILFPCFHIIHQTNNLGHLPLTWAWYNRMLEQEEILLPMLMILDVELPESGNCEIPTVPLESLYKSDPKRYKPASRIYTRQEDIEASLQLFSKCGLSAPWLDRTFGWEVSLDWSTIPPEAHPEGGDLPASRLDRKREQLECMARAVLKIARPSDVIADFCSGSGHLGLLLAVLLPSCRVLLLENKAESQARAKSRGARLSLTNVTYIQSNLDYFVGSFDVGVALHACGVAADLVLARCIERGASFVVCPCCYGGIQTTHATQYPRSKILRAAAMTLRDYLVLAHAADQTHGEEHEKSAQGNQCMAAVDADRCVAASEAGYLVSLSKLEPASCSPKNNLLVGQPSVLYDPEK